jgi:hypothetical protein
MTGALYGPCQLALVLRAGAGDAARKHLALVVEITLELIRVLEVDVLDTGLRELTLSLLAMLAGRGDVPDEGFSLGSLFRSAVCHDIKEFRVYV